MASKSAKCDKNTIKIAIFAAKLQKLLSGWELRPQVPAVTRLSCISLLSTWHKLDNFNEKKIYFWFTPLSKILDARLVAFTAANRFFKQLRAADETNLGALPALQVPFLDMILNF